MDRNGTSYFVDRAAAGATHIHALTATGEMLWTIQTPNFGPSSIAFDGQGHLYLTGQRGMRSRLVCIAD